MRLTSRTWLQLFLIGGVAGALYDQIHVRGGVLVYPRHDFLQQSWWVAPNFGLAAVMIALTGGWIARWASRKHLGTQDNRELLGHFAWFTLAYLASAFLPLQPPLVLALFVATWLGRVLPRRDRVPQLIQGLGLAVAGTTFETVLSATGAFHYLRPDLVYVPSWLPGLYLHGAPLALALLVRVQPPEMNKP
jgi:hypothetical protein